MDAVVKTAVANADKAALRDLCYTSMPPCMDGYKRFHLARSEERAMGKSPSPQSNSNV